MSDSRAFLPELCEPIARARAQFHSLFRTVYRTRHGSAAFLLGEPGSGIPRTDAAIRAIYAQLSERARPEQGVYYPLSLNTNLNLRLRT